MGRVISESEINSGNSKCGGKGYALQQIINDIGLTGLYKSFIPTFSWVYMLSKKCGTQTRGVRLALKRWVMRIKYCMYVPEALKSGDPRI